MNTDELLEQILKDELEDAQYLTPREYAKLNYRSPQLIYYHIRSKHIPVHTCQCGRKVIAVKEADEYFRELDNAARRSKGLPTKA